MAIIKFLLDVEIGGLWPLIERILVAINRENNSLHRTFQTSLPGGQQ
jgi:hypothetical protein